MKYYLDTEFHEFKKKPLFSESINTIELISIGIVSEEGQGYYEVCKDFDLKVAWKNDWLRNNVLLPIFFDLAHEDFHLTHFKDEWLRNGEEVTLETFKANDTWANDRKWFAKLINKYGKTREQIREGIYNFINPHYQGLVRMIPNPSFDPDSSISGPNIIKVVDESFVPNQPEFWAYYGDYDWVVFCWLFGRMIDLPKGFPKYCRDLKQLLDDKVEPLEWYYGRDIWSSSGVFGEGPRQATDRLATLEEKLKRIKKLKAYPTQDNAHNALDDARWNKSLHYFLDHTFSLDTSRSKQ